MRVALLRTRAEWRRRWPTLIALTLLIGLVGTVVLGAMAGARRTRSTVDRFIATTKTMDVFMSFNETSADSAAAIRGLPEVDLAAGFAGFTGFAETASQFLYFLAPVDGALGVEVVRDLLIDGRRPEPGQPFEIAVSESVAARHALAVGDGWTIHTVSAEQFRCFSASSESPSPDDTCADLYIGLFESDPPDLSLLEGPRLELNVVGITRGPFDVAQADAATSVVVANQGLYAEVGPEIASFPGMLVVYAPGVTDEAFEAALAGVVDAETISDLDPATAVTDALHTTAGVLSTGLLVFSGVAAVLGALAVAQAVARQVAGSDDERSILHAFGLDRRGRALDALAPVAPVAIGGGLLAIAGAWAISPVMPVASARRFEPEPGAQFDLPVLLGGAAVLALLVVVFGALGIVGGTLASRARARRASRNIRARSVPAGLGIWFALDRGDRKSSIPVRSAVSGAALGVCGVLAATTFAAALTRLTSDPGRYGYGWDASVNGCSADRDCSSDNEAAADVLVAEHPDVAGAARIWYQGRIAVEGRSEPAYAQRAIEGDVGFTVLRGRAPVAGDEVALGAQTLERHGLDIGDPIELDGREFDIVGQALFPAGSDSFPLAEGVLLSEAGLRAIGVGVTEWSSDIAVRLEPRVDREDALGHLAALNSGQPPIMPVLPVEVDDLEQLEALPGLLAGFLILVALLAVGHAVAVTVRRRAREIGVARALGLTSGGVGAVVRWQATVISVLGIAIGAPLGLLLGRFVWDRIADSYGFAGDQAWPWPVLFAVAPLTLAATLLLAWAPARRAARLRPSEILRTE